jgi:hypothetical protein
MLALLRVTSCVEVPQFMIRAFQPLPQLDPYMQTSFSRELASFTTGGRAVV